MENTKWYFWNNLGTLSIELDFPQPLVFMIYLKNMVLCYETAENLQKCEHS